MVKVVGDPNCNRRVDPHGELNDMFIRLMGDLIEPRREFIQANALDAEVDV